MIRLHYILKPKSNTDILAALDYKDYNDLLIKSAQIKFSYGVELALKHEDKIDCNNGKILKIGVKMNNFRIFKLCLQKGIDIHYQQDVALRYAASNGNIRMVKILIAKGADINTIDSQALRYAVDLNDIKMMELLVKHGANIHAAGSLALFNCLQFHRLEVAELLLLAGARLSKYWNNEIHGNAKTLLNKYK